MMRTAYQIVLESTDSASDDKSNESICSLQDEPTVSVKDSSDIMTEFSSEFELATSPEMKPHPWSFSPNFLSSGSSSHHISNRIYVAPLLIESDVREISTDDSNYDTDEDIQIVKFPRCIMCSAVNENYFFQFCHSCYQIKKGFFPTKPKAKKRKERQTSIKNYYAYDLAEDASKGKISLLQRNEKYFKNKGSPTLDGESNFREFSTVNKLSTSSGIASPTCTSPSCTQDSGIGSSNTLDWRINSKNDEKCLACFVKETNALFLHGKTGHKCCCYQCAKRIWFETRRCPICRSKVNNVIKILNS